MPEAKIPSVVLIDDDHSTRFTIAEMLASFGFDVRMAPGGEEGLALIRELGQSLAVVLLDHHMAPMDGRTVLTAIRSDPRLASIPVVIVSAYADPGLFPDANGFLRKPFTVKQLLDTVYGFRA